MSDFDSKMDIKKVIKDSIEEYVAPLKAEIEILSKSINKDIRMNYLSTIARVLDKEAEEIVGNFSCAYDITTGIECKSKIKESIAKYTQALAMGDIPNSLSEITSLERKAKKNAHDPDRSVICSNDWKEVVRITKRHKDVVKELSATYSATKVPGDIAEFEFNTEKLFSEVIFPFSHQLRIDIVHSLMSGAK